METNDEEETQKKEYVSSETNGEVEVPMDLDESLTSRNEQKLVLEGIPAALHKSSAANVSTSSTISLNETACSIIDIQDSTPDVSCEFLLAETSHNLGLPPRHSDIYITDVYNATEQANSTISPSVEKEAQDNAPIVEFLEPALIHQPAALNVVDEIKTVASLASTRGNLRLSVNVEYLVTHSSAGGTVNELLGLHCTPIEAPGFIGRYSGSSGGFGDVSTSASTGDVGHNPPVIINRKLARYSHASSTSTSSSIASSASALARSIKLRPTQGSPHVLLSNERINELRDKWNNSREVWRVLDYIDRYITENKNRSASVTPPQQQPLELIEEVATPTSSTTKRATKVKFDDQHSNAGTPRKRRKATSSLASNGHDNVTSACAPVVIYKTGDRVFAKWTDRKFYAATLVERGNDGRWTVDFYDGDTKTVSEENILLADELAFIGQRVYASHTDDDFTVGIVTGCEPDATSGQLLYSVARDDHDVCVPAKHILLTESQARQIRARCTRQQNGNSVSSSTGTDEGGASAPHVSSACSCPQVQPQTPSGRTLRPRTRAPARNSPVPSSSGWQQKRRQAVSTLATVPGSDSEDDVTSTDAQSPCNGLDSYIPGLEIEAAAAYDGCGRLKGKTVAGKMRFFGGGCQKDVAALGPLPPAGCQPFKGLHILLSCVRPSAGSDVMVSAAASDTGSCSSSNENYRFSTAPCVKARLREQLLAGGANVYAKFEDLLARNYKHAYLISNRPSHSAQYVMCLAAGVRPVCHEWVIRCCVEGRALPPQDLPCGWSLERERFISAFERPVIGTGANSGRPLRRKLVFVASGTEPQFTQFWTRVLELAEANVRPLASAADVEFGRALCVLCEHGYRDERTERAQQRGLPLATPLWLIQTLIHGELRDLSRLPAYRPDSD